MNRKSQQQKAFGCKLWPMEFYREISPRFSPTNSVPAVAVRQRGIVLSIWTRPKARVGGSGTFLKLPRRVEALEKDS